MWNSLVQVHTRSAVIAAVEQDLVADGVIPAQTIRNEFRSVFDFFFHLFLLTGSSRANYSRGVMSDF